MLFTKKAILFILVFFVSKNIWGQPPTITSFSPNKGPIGTQVIINGTNFSSTPSNNIVYFGAVRAAVVNSTTNTLSVTVPVGATFQPITITTNNLTAYSTYPFIATFSGGTGGFFANSFTNTNIKTNSVGMFPCSIADGDIDGDGKADLVIVNTTLSTISIFRNISTTDTILFAPPINYSTGNYPQVAALGDINGDGRLDIATPNSNDNSLSILLNTSSSGYVSFAPKVDFTTGSYPYNMAIADLDGDGKPELAVTNFDDASLSIFKNKSTPHLIDFNVRTNFPTGDKPNGININDINNDGKPDIVVTNIFNNNISILKNVSGSNILFENRINFSTGYGPQQLSVGDLDGDEKPDIVATGNQTINVLKNAGSGGNIAFTGATSLTTTGNHSALITDLDGDGKPDIAAASLLINAASVFKNSSFTGSIGFTFPVYYQSGYTAAKIAISDFDGDGKPDLSIVHPNSFTVLRNRINEPDITSFSSNAGCSVAGSTITIKGSKFTGTTNVKFDGMPAVSFNVISDEVIVAVAPAPVKQNITVITNFGKGNFAIPPPTISSFTPINAPIGSTLLVKGNYFCSTQNVKIDDNTVNFNVSSDTSLTAIIGAGMAGSLSVTTSQGTATLGGFNNMAVPVITSFFPDSATINDKVTIKGKYFTRASAVSFGGTASQSFTVISDTSISAVVAEGTSGSISIKIPNGIDSIAGFKFFTPDTTIYACRRDTTFITSNLLGSYYQWQINTGNGFTDLPYQNRFQLWLYPPKTKASYGYKYRCSVNGKYSNVYTLTFANT